MSLFRRQGSWVALTDAGRRLHDFALRILDLHHHARPEVTGRTFWSAPPYLNVRGEEALRAVVRRCWASLWTARARPTRTNCPLAEVRDVARLNQGRAVIQVVEVNRSRAEGAGLLRRLAAENRGAYRRVAPGG